MKLLRILLFLITFTLSQTTTTMATNSTGDPTTDLLTNSLPTWCMQVVTVIGVGVMVTDKYLIPLGKKLIDLCASAKTACCAPRTQQVDEVHELITDLGLRNSTISKKLVSFTDMLREHMSLQSKVAPNDFKLDELRSEDKSNALIGFRFNLGPTLTIEIERTEGDTFEKLAVKAPQEIPLKRSDELIIQIEETTPKEKIEEKAETTGGKNDESEEMKVVIEDTKKVVKDDKIGHKKLGLITQYVPVTLESQKRVIKDIRGKLGYFSDKSKEMDDFTSFISGLIVSQTARLGTGGGDLLTPFDFVQFGNIIVNQEKEDEKVFQNLLEMRVKFTPLVKQSDEIASIIETKIPRTLRLRAKIEDSDDTQ